MSQSVRADDSGAAAVGATLLSSTGAVEGAAADRGLPNRHPCVRRRARLTVKLDADKAKPSLDDPALIIDASELFVGNAAAGLL